MLIWFAFEPAASSRALSSLMYARSGAVVVLRDVVALELDVPHAIDVDVVLREIEDVERPLRRRFLPRQLDDAAVVQGHDGDARQLLGRDIRGAATAAPATAAARLPAHRPAADPPAPDLARSRSP